VSGMDVDLLEVSDAGLEHFDVCKSYGTASARATQR
jgi:hypothetical protein